MYSILNSAIWVYGRVFITQIFNLVTVGIIARIVEPKAFGIVALGTILLSLVKVFVSQGFNQFIIFDKTEDYENRQYTAFWLATLIGLAVMVFGILLAESISNWYEEPDLKLVLIVILLRIPFDSALSVSDAITHKALQFKIIEIRDSILFAFSSVIAITLALSGYGIWALVVPNLLILPVRLLLSFKISKWIPKLYFFWGDVRKIFNYTIHVIGSSVTTFFISEGDSLIIGKTLGLTELGIYNIAWRSSNLIIRTFVNTANRLLFPWLNSHADNMNRFINSIIKVLSTVSFFIFPLLFLMIVVAEDFIYIIYGPKWYAAVLPLQILMIYTIRYSIGAPIGLALKALGRPDLVFKIVIITLPFYIISIFVGSRWGIVGVALAVTIVRTSFGMINFLVLARICKTQMITFLKPIFKPFIISLVMLIFVGSISSFYDMDQITDRLIRLILSVTFGFIFYCILMRIFNPILLIEMHKIIEIVVGRKINIVRKLFMLNIK